MMNSVLLRVATFIFTIFLTESSFAQADGTCLKVDFHNNTDFTCTITNHHNRHGTWVKEPPESVAAHESTYWGGYKVDCLRGLIWMQHLNVVATTVA